MTTAQRIAIILIFAAVGILLGVLSVGGGLP